MRDLDQKAQTHRAEIARRLEDVVEALEDARRDGFQTEFGIQGAPGEPYRLTNVNLVKRW